MRSRRLTRICPQKKNLLGKFVIVAQTRAVDDDALISSNEFHFRLLCLQFTLKVNVDALFLCSPIVLRLSVDDDDSCVGSHILFLLFLFAGV